MVNFWPLIESVIIRHVDDHKNFLGSIEYTSISRIILIEYSKRFLYTAVYVGHSIQSFLDFALKFKFQVIISANVNIKSRLWGSWKKTSERKKWGDKETFKKRCEGRGWWGSVGRDGGDEEGKDKQLIRPTRRHSPEKRQLRKVRGGHQHQRTRHLI